MYCYQCGAKLLPEAKFCHQCGQKMDRSEENLDNKAIQDIEEGSKTEPEVVQTKHAMEIMNPVQRIAGPEITLRILGHQVALSDEIAGLKVVRDYFHDYAEKNAAKYRDYLKFNVKNFDDIYDKAIPFSINCIKEAINNAVEIAKKLGIFDMSYEWLGLLLEGHMDCDELFSNYTRIAAILENSASKLASYRGLQRANVPQWRGGGFGIIGAIKGQMQATALNIGTNVIREIGNAITDSRDKEKFRKAKEMLYKDTGLIDNLVMITYNCSFMPYYALLPIFEEANIVSADAERDEEAVEEIQVIFEDYFNGAKEQEDCIELILQNIQKHPFDPVFYVYAEWICEEAGDDIAEVIDILNLKFLYRHEKKALEIELFNDIKKVEDVSVTAIGCKLKLLRIVERSGVKTKNEIEAVRWDLRKAWANVVQLLPEYDETEMQKKIKAYQELKEEYGTETRSFKSYEEDIWRLERKLEDKVMLPILEMSTSEVKREKDKIDALVKEKRFDELWAIAETQNGYAQTLLYRFYVARTGSMKGKIGSIEQIRVRCPYLNQKLQEESLFAKFIYDVLVCKIRQICNLAPDREMDRKIHSDYLFVISEAARKGIVYAKHCLVIEIASKYDWENYESFRRRDARLYDFPYRDVMLFIKETANALIPGAVDRLSDMYKGKGNTHLYEVKLNYQRSDQLSEFVRQLNVLDTLDVMEHTYELYAIEPGEVAERKIICSQCGSPITEGKKFCSQCGRKIM